MKLKNRIDNLQKRVRPQPRPLRIGLSASHNLDDLREKVIRCKQYNQRSSMVQHFVCYDGPDCPEARELLASVPGSSGEKFGAIQQ